jgi:hypothetical protein
VESQGKYFGLLGKLCCSRALRYAIFGFVKEAELTE